MAGRLHRGLATALIAGSIACSPREQVSPPSPAVPAPVIAPTPTATAEAPVEPPPSAPFELDLELDFDVGFEVPTPPPPGEFAIWRRDRRRYLTVEEWVLKQPAFWPALKKELPGKSLSIDGERLCDTRFADIVRTARTPRLLLKVDGELTEAGAACMAALETPKIYFTGCHAVVSGECDGDRQLRRILATPGLPEKVRGLAIFLFDDASLPTLGGFSHLEYLTLSNQRLPKRQGMMKTAVPLCDLTELRALDLFWFDGHSDTFTPKCLGRLHRLKTRGLFTRAPAPDCALRVVSLGHLDKTAARALSTCTSIERLTAMGTNISSLATLSNHTALRELVLRHADVNDFASLQAFPALRLLHLSGVSAKSFDDLADLPVEDLDLSFAAITDLTPLGSLPLKNLDLGFTKVQNLTPLANVKTLLALDLHKTLVRDIGPLASLTELRQLKLSETRVVSVAPLAKHHALEKLWLYDSRVSSIAPLRGLLKPPAGQERELEVLDVSGLKLPASELAPFRKALDRGLRTNTL